MRAHPHPYNI
jgi:hypothetical protein